MTGGDGDDSGQDLDSPADDRYKLFTTSNSALPTNSVTTVAVDGMSFLAPVYVGDIVNCHATLVKVGRTSMTLHVEAWAQRYLSDLRERVTHAEIIMVALDSDGNPSPVPPEK